MRRSFCLCLWVLLFIILAPAVYSCSLPAEPTANAVPVKNPDMKLVEEGNYFYYLVPEGTTAQLKILWDPARHNSGSLSAGEYKGVAGIAAIDTTVDAPNGYGFFELAAMSEFFSVKGRRGDLKEAFSRDSGADLGADFVPDMSMGPYPLLSSFAKPGQEQEFSIIDNKSGSFPEASVVTPSFESAIEVTPAVNDKLPCRDWLGEPEDLKLEDGSIVSLKLYTVNVGGVEKKVYIHDCCLDIQNLDITVTEIEPEKYKAYIVDGNEAAKVYTMGLPVMPDNSKDGTPGPTMNVTFVTPTMNGDKESSKIKVKVYAPSAGYVLKNMFWCWNERVYVQKTVTTSTPKVDADGNPVLDADGNPVMETTSNTFWEVEDENKTSVELELTVYKPAKSGAYSAYIVYDNKHPVASDFKIVGEPKFSESGPSTFNYEMRLIDTNPYVDKVFSSSLAGVDMSQSTAKETLGVEIFYSYCTYDYEGAEADLNSLKNGYGLAELADRSGTSPNFKTYKVKSGEPKWFWKAATVESANLTLVNKISEGGRYCGAEYKITGTFTVDNVKPWHACTEGTPSDPVPEFKVFAMARDTRVSPSTPFVLYDGIVNWVKANQDVQSDVAAEVIGADDGTYWVVNPANGGDIEQGSEDEYGLIEDKASWGDASKWQKYRNCFLKCTDDVGPEIEVVIFDTRTNKYHVYGTAGGATNPDVAGGFCNMTSRTGDTKYTTGPFPYLGKESAIAAAHDFKGFVPSVDNLFTRILSGADAICTVSNADKDIKGFVCQKNTRLVFYARAFDNINGHKNGCGVQSISGTVENGEETITFNPDSSCSLGATECLFRFENATSAGCGAPYKLHVEATDYNGHTRNLDIDIAVIGRKLDIRTLEERRNRVD
ncbi:MAG: hypothetical protein Kow0029_06400 [Candidatus Rifleibacteriota bacterium]